jgi:hypothetical protein
VEKEAMTDTIESSLFGMACNLNRHKAYRVSGSHIFLDRLHPSRITLPIVSPV